MIKLTDSTGIFKGKSYLVSPAHDIAVDAMAHAIAFQQPQIILLLSKYNIPVSAKPTKSELLKSLLLGFSNKNMQLDFTGMLLGRMSRFSNVDDAPLFDEEGHPLTTGGVIAGSADDPNACTWWSKTFGNCGKPYTPSTATAGSGNVFTNTLAGITGILGLFNKPDTTALSQQTNAQILALAAEKETARKRNNIIAISATLLLIIGVVIGLVRYANKNKAKQ